MAEIHGSDTVEDVFRKVFTSAGYTEQAPSPIFPCPDLTTLFTGATINVLKGRLSGNGLDNVFVIQPCLRTQSLQHVLDRNFDPEYLSRFIMLGILSPPGGELISGCICRFFDEFPGLTDRLLVRSSKTLENDTFSKLDSQYRVEYDTRNPHYYRWRYGEDSLVGVGVTFAIEQSSGEFLDIGNLVLMYKSDNPVAMEFGFGLETFTARLLDKKSPYTMSQNYLHLRLGLSPAEKRLGDCLLVARQLFENGVMPGTGKAASVMRKALRSVFFAALRDYGDLADDKIRHLAKAASDEARWLALVERVYGAVKDAIESFNHEVSHMRKHASGLRLDMKIKEYRLRYGIPEQF